MEQDTSFNANDQAVLEIAQELSKIMKESIDSTISISWNDLIIAASSFIARYEQLKKMTLSSTHVNIFKNAMGLIRKTDERQILVQAAYAYAFQFDDKLKAFRGQAPSKALYVIGGYITKRGRNIPPTSYEIPLVSLIKFMDIQKGGRLNASRKALEEEQGKKKENNINKEHLIHAQAAYTGTLNRLSRFWEKIREKKLASGLKRNQIQNQSGLLMWKQGHDWAVARVLNVGDLKEAYASYLLTEHNSLRDKLCSVNIGSPQYYHHNLIKIFFKNHIAFVDNAKAIQNEDVISSDGTIQWGVKSSSAEMPSISQYYEIAKWIVTHSTATKKELEEEIMADKPVFRNTIVGRLNEITDENKDILLEVLKSTKNFK